MSELVMVQSGSAVWARGFDREAMMGFDSPKFVAVSLFRALSALADHIAENVDDYIIEVDLVLLSHRVAFDEHGDTFKMEFEIEFEALDGEGNPATAWAWRTIEFEHEPVKVISVQ